MSMERQKEIPKDRLLSLERELRGNDEIDWDDIDMQEKRDARIDVENALSKLEKENKEYADILREYYWLRKSREEIVNRLGVPGEIVRQKIGRARDMLARLLGDEYI